MKIRNINNLEPDNPFEWTAMNWWQFDLVEQSIIEAVAR